MSRKVGPFLSFDYYFDHRYCLDSKARQGSGNTHCRARSKLLQKWYCLSPLRLRDGLLSMTTRQICNLADPLAWYWKFVHLERGFWAFDRATSVDFANLPNIDFHFWIASQCGVINKDCAADSAHRNHFCCFCQQLWPLWETVAQICQLTCY